MQERFEELGRRDFSAHYTAQEHGYNTAGEHWYLSGARGPRAAVVAAEGREYEGFKATAERAASVLATWNPYGKISWLNWLDLLRAHSPHFEVLHHSRSNPRVSEGEDGGIIRCVVKASLEFWRDTLDAVDKLTVREAVLQKREKAVEAGMARLEERIAAWAAIAAKKQKAGLWPKPKKRAAQKARKRA